MPNTSSASQECKIKEADSKNVARYTHDGALIEGTGIGGKVVIV